MASIFEGVPFIVRIPGEYKEDSSALNAGLAAGAAAARTQLARQQGAEQNRLESRKLDIEERQNDLTKLMQGLRIKGLLMDQEMTKQQILDQSAFADWFSSFQTNPNTPLPNFSTPAMTEKALDVQAKGQAKAGIISQKDMVNRYMSQINELAPELQTSFLRRFQQELPNGISDSFRSDLSEALGMNPTPSNFAYAQDQFEKAKAAGDEISAKTWADKIDRLSNAATFAKSQFTIQTGPEGTTISQGPAKAGGANLGKAAIQDIAIDNTANAIWDLRKNIQPGNVGLQGKGGELFLDKMLPMFGVNQYFDPQRTDWRTKLKAMIEGAKGTITAENRFSDQDAKRIAELMPDSGWIESAPRTAQILDTMGKIFAERKLRLALETNNNDLNKVRQQIISQGKFANPYLIREAKDKGFITFDEAKALLSGATIQ